MKIKTFEVVAKLALFLCLLIPSTVGATGYTLTVSAQGSGTVTKNPTNAIYPSGVTVTITATPNAGWYFANWSGDTNGAVNPLNVAMNANLVITGNFLAFPSYSLTLVTNGQGTIALNPPGGSYLSNTVVAATATPAAGWVFAGWTGGTNTSANPVALTMNGNSSLTGTFAQLPSFDFQPVSVTNVAGSTVSFSAHAVGTAPLHYQWFFSGGSLSGVITNTTLALTNVSSGQAGNYWVVATNNYGSATSQMASLTLPTSGGPTNVVNSPDEASLRAAIQIGGWVGLNFNGTVTITNTIAITNRVFLDGRTYTATISGGNAVRLFYVAPGVTFSATNLTLANGSCIMTNNAATTNADAGAIYNDGGTVNLTGCALVNNHAQSIVYARGGAIFNNGGLVLLVGTIVSSNNATGLGYYQFPSTFISGAGYGGAIYTINGSCSFVNCMFNNNSCKSGGDIAIGGALFQSSGVLTITNCAFATNSALGGSLPIQSGNPPSGEPAYGGALAVAAGSAAIDYSQFTGNAAQGGTGSGANGTGMGGAIYSASILKVGHSSFYANAGLAAASAFSSVGNSGFGGAVYNTGTLELNGCAICSNYVQGGWGNSSHFSLSGRGGDGLGGGIFNAAQLAITNCTIALNSTINGSGTVGGANGNALGGGVFTALNAVFTAMNVTIASNSCMQGTYASSGGSIIGLAAGCQIANTNGTLRLHNTIVAYAGTNSNAYGPITDDGYNICSDGSANFASGSSYNFTDPQLAPLGDYGGPTWCMALLPTSPAIDFGDSNGIPNTDQRGFVRPFGSGADIGAYEYGSYQAGVLQLNITATKTNILLSFTATPPNAYRLQASTNLTTWTDLNTNGPFASATNINQTISQQGFNRRYFRLLVQ
jgi:hypothetical protein